MKDKGDITASTHCRAPSRFRQRASCVARWRPHGARSHARDARSHDRAPASDSSAERLAVKVWFDWLSYNERDMQITHQLAEVLLLTRNLHLGELATRLTHRTTATYASAFTTTTTTTAACSARTAETQALEATQIRP